MTRRGQPIKVESTFLVYEAKSEDEKIKLAAAKEILKRNDLEQREFVKDAIEKFLRKHNWPPGNSQTQLETFGAKCKRICGFCGREAAQLYHCRFISGLEKYVCKKCKDDCEERTTLDKVIKIV